MTRISFIFFLPIFLIISNCDAYRDYKNNKAPSLTLPAPAPQKWQSTPTDSSEIELLKTGWIQEFQDQKIVEIAKEIIKHNYDLKIAANNVIAAKASAEKAGSLLKPDAFFSFKNNNDGNFDQNNSNITNGVSLDISYEIDLWGKLAAIKDSATNTYEASKEDYIAMRESLITQGVKAYFLAIATYEQVNLNKEIVASFRKDLDIIEAFYQEGTKTLQDVYLAKTNLAKSEDDLEVAINAHKESIRSLEILLGQYPKGKYAIAKSLPNKPSPIQAGIPSDILEQRPDIRSAERDVAAAFSQTTIRKAARLPSISLTSSVGSNSDDLNLLSDPKSSFWNLASNLLVPLFDGGALKADVKISEANQLTAINNYQKAAYNAFNEVETALINIDTLNKRIKLLDLASTQAELAYEFAHSKYLQGKGNLLDVSEFKRSMYAAKADLINAKEDLLGQYTNLYLALGLKAFPQDKQ